MATVARDTRPLGEILRERTDLTWVQLEDGLHRHMRDNVHIGEALVSEGALSQDDVWAGLAQQWGIGMHDISHHWVDPALANELDAREAIRLRVLPIRAGGGTAVVAMADPRDEAALEHLQSTLH
ncbi:MAG: hypothetical protein JOY80_07555, partial [Candidatus Dormibacteraeota bacterium]|nr:hypothetical protein [Candidatus Dormibacteraeota bacterium]